MKMSTSNTSLTLFSKSFDSFSAFSATSGSGYLILCGTAMMVLKEGNQGAPNLHSGPYLWHDFVQLCMLTLFTMSTVIGSFKLHVQNLSINLAN